MPQYSIILVRPQFSGNLGAVARAMRNMGLSDLVLVEPKADPNSEEARKFAVQAYPILERARIFSKLAEALADFHEVVGTSRRLGGDRLESMVPREFALESVADVPEKRIAILFGHEADGLSLDELKFCRRLIEIPASAEFGSLNLSQAVMIVAYELFLARPREVSEEKELPATVQSVEGLFADFESLLGVCGFFKPGNAPHIMRLLRNFFHRASVREAEVSLFRGVLRQVRWWAKK